MWLCFIYRSSKDYFISARLESLGEQRKCVLGGERRGEIINPDDFVLNSPAAARCSWSAPDSSHPTNRTTTKQSMSDLLTNELRILWVTAVVKSLSTLHCFFHPYKLILNMAAFQQRGGWIWIMSVWWMSGLLLHSQVAERTERIKWWGEEGD